MNDSKHWEILELPKILERLAGKTACAAAADLARALRPTGILEEAELRLAQTKEAYDRTGDSSAPSFGGLTDVSAAVRRAEAGGVLSMSELLAVAGVLRVVRGLDEWAESAGRARLRALGPFFDALSPNKYLEELIARSIVSEEEMSDRASPELADIRRKIRSVGERAREWLDRFVRSSSAQKYLQDALVTVRDNRYVVPVKAEFKNEVPGLVHDTSASGATLFVEPMAVVEFNNELRVLAAKERDEIRRILEELSGEVASFAEPILCSLESALELNVVFAKAALAYEMRAAEPVLNERGLIRLNKARHPLLDPATAVPIDVALGDKYSVLVITGPNTGGKTVTLKTVGLLTLMAACGLMIPAGDDSAVSVFDRVLADIGDEQSIEQSLSTFSSHMKNMTEILAVADERSLVLADELGAGTDPVEGAALAAAILEEFRLRGTKVAATTHYAELKAYALDTEGVENAGCEFDVETLRPTYRLIVGIPGRSNAFAISAKLGLPAEVLARAESYVSKEDRRFESVVRSLEETGNALERERRTVAELRRELTESRETLRRERERAEKERAEILKAARQKAADTVEKAGREAAALLEEMEKLKKSLNAQNAADLTRRARALMKSGLSKAADAADPVEEFRPTENLSERPPRKGDRVLLLDLGQTAEVTEDPDRSGQVSVRVGMIATRVPVSKLRVVDAPKPKKSAPPRTGPGLESRGVRAAELELDLRGKTVDEALPDVDAFLDRAFLAGSETVRIIHGKGTGALRAAVQKHLRGHPHVATSRLGGFSEGGDGVTVVTVKR